MADADAADTDAADTDAANGVWNRSSDTSGGSRASIFSAMRMSDAMLSSKVAASSVSGCLYDTCVDMMGIAGFRWDGKWKLEVELDKEGQKMRWEDGAKRR